MRNKYTEIQRKKISPNIFYDGLLDKFHTAIFMVDFDNPKTPNVDVFNMFNNAWVAFAESFNKKAKRVSVDPKAFYNYAINQEV